MSCTKCGGPTLDIYDHPLVESNGLCWHCNRENKKCSDNNKSGGRGGNGTYTERWYEGASVTHKYADSNDDSKGNVICSICNWCNTNLLNIGEPGKPRMVCQGCCKRAFEKLDKIKEVI
jgi:hypothetical protein